jgi:lysophospholipase L1-like esterase
LFAFAFGEGAGAKGYKAVPATATYSKEQGYGFEPGLAPDGAKPSLFSVALPEGNYKVTATLGDVKDATDTTVKAELRRLMLDGVKTDPGRFVTRSFMVNIRTPQIPDSKPVGLKPREKASEARAWDDKLTLEFNGSRPGLRALTIEKAPADMPVVYLLGDSTVCDQPAEPWTSWGQMLTILLKPDVIVSNQAESGETIASSIGARRVAKVMSTLKAADYVFVQFGHNDMKRGTPEATGYGENLAKVVDQARAKGATPVLVAPMERKGGIVKDTLGDYPQAVIAVAKEKNVASIDLHAMSKVLYKAMGKDMPKAFRDGTHHTGYGALEMAKCVAQGIKDAKLPLAKSLVDDFKGFDPAHPDALADFHVPASPVVSKVKPLGS